MQRYFIKNNQIKKNLIEISGQDYHHIKNVMRMKLDDLVEVCDESENVYISKILKIDKLNIVLEILNKIDSFVEMPSSITIALGLTRSSKLEEVIKRITELGASAFIPVEMSRSVVRINKDKKTKTDRLNLIVKEAAEQSKRTKLLKIYEPIKFKDLISSLDKYDVLVYAFENLKTNSKDKLKHLIPKFRGKDVLIIVGPEGGFSPEESETLDNLGFIAVGLGPRILRLETAPLYLMSAISYELEL